MLIFLTILGLGLALLLFLNGLHAADRVKTGTAQKSKGHVSSEPVVLDSRKVMQMAPGEKRPRICPVCGTMLSQADYLIAALEPEPRTERRRQAHIYGCPYCLENGGVNLHRERQLTRLEP